MNAVVRKHRVHAIIAIAGLVGSMVWNPGPAQGAVASVTRVTTAETSDEIQISVVASAPVQYQLRHIRPDWIVMDVSPVTLGALPGMVPSAPQIVRNIRVNQYERDVVRVVIELAKPMAFRVAPSDGRKVLFVSIPTGTSAPAAPAAAPQARLRAPQSRWGTPVPAAGAAQPRAGLGKHVSIMPGVSSGRVRLRMRIQDAEAVLGPPVSKEVFPDGSVTYRWFGPPKNSGLGIRTTPDGLVTRIWALNDAQYAVIDRIRAGTTEAVVRKTLGTPSDVAPDPQHGMKILIYRSLGVWVAIQLDRRLAFYNGAFEIGVMQPTITSHAGN